jgi:hypothetical protein
MSTHMLGDIVWLSGRRRIPDCRIRAVARARRGERDWPFSNRIFRVAKRQFRRLRLARKKRRGWA